jgi:arginase
VEAGLLDQLRQIGWQVDAPATLPTFEHHRNIATIPHPVLKNVGFVSQVTKEIHQLVKDTCSKKQLALTLGGDHSVAIGSVSGSAAVNPNLGIIWVDAHAVRNGCFSWLWGHGVMVGARIGHQHVGNNPQWEHPWDARVFSGWIRAERTCV